MLDRAGRCMQDMTCAVLEDACQVPNRRLISVPSQCVLYDRAWAEARKVTSPADTTGQRTGSGVWGLRGVKCRKHCS